MSEALVEQIFNKIPTLTDEQISALNSVSVPVDEMVSAIAIPGLVDELNVIMGQFGTELNPGVWAIARIAIIGILAEGKIDQAVSDTLIRAWTDVIEPFHRPTLVEVEQIEKLEVENGLSEDPQEAKDVLPEVVAEAHLEAPEAPISPTEGSEVTSQILNENVVPPASTTGDPSVGAI